MKVKTIIMALVICSMTIISCQNRNNIKITSESLTINMNQSLNWETIESLSFRGHEYVAVQSVNGSYLFLFDKNGDESKKYILGKNNFQEKLWGHGCISGNRYIVLFEDRITILSLETGVIKNISINPLFTDKSGNSVTLGILQRNKVPIVEYHGKLVLPRYSMSYSHWDSRFYNVPLFSLFDIDSGKEHKTLPVGYLKEFEKNVYGAANFYNFFVKDESLYYSFAMSNDLFKYDINLGEHQESFSVPDNYNDFKCFPFDTSNGNNMTKVLDHLVQNDLTYDLNYDKLHDVIYQTIWRGARLNKTKLIPTLVDKSVKVNIFSGLGEYIGSHELVKESLATDKSFVWNGKLCFKNN